MCRDLGSVYESMVADGFIPKDGTVLANVQHIVEMARQSDDGERCMIAPSPDLREKMNQDLTRLRGLEGTVMGGMLHSVELPSPGFNDGVIIPPEEYPLGTPLSVIKSGAADKAPLRGTVRVIVVLVDFTDKHIVQNQAHFTSLFFGIGGAKKSVREYYQEVTQELVDIQGQVVGPFRLPQTYAAYAHGASGTGAALPNASTMARDAVIAANPSVNFATYDNDGNGFVDAFIVIHAGPGGEVTGNVNDIWSHKWTLDGGARNMDGTKVYGYLTVPEDCEIGVCAHELGHLLFGFPDLYDTDYSSEGIGNWCLMAGGSWGGSPQGSKPVHPSAWCQANQGWAAVNVRTTNGVMNIPDVKDPSPTVYRLWKDGGPGAEYFLMENRQKTGFDASLPAGGLLIWHIDEAITSNRDENHPKVALMQADGKRDMELNHNRGDAGDPYPGSTNNTSFSQTSTPSSKSYANVATCVSVTGISPSAHTMTANVQVRCGKVKDKDKDKELRKEVIKEKDLRKERVKDKEIRKEIIKEKELRKELIKEGPEKPIREKGGKELVEGKLTEGKLTEGRPGGLGFGTSGSSQDQNQLEERVAFLEEALIALAGMGGGEPFIESDLRPDLRGGAYSGEEDASNVLGYGQDGPASSKRQYDTKQSEN